MVLAGLGWATVKFGRRTLAALDDRLPVGIRSHWGDFGGGNAGWEASPALSLLACTLLLLILLVVVTTSLLTVAKPTKTERPPSPAVRDSATAKP